jgi:hypothetical protein
LKKIGFRITSKHSNTYFYCIFSYCSSETLKSNKNKYFDKRFQIFNLIAIKIKRKGTNKKRNIEEEDTRRVEDERTLCQPAGTQLLLMPSRAPANTNCRCPCRRMGRRCLAKNRLLLPVSTLHRRGTGKKEFWFTIRVNESRSVLSNQNVPVETFATFEVSDSLVLPQLRKICCKKLQFIDHSTKIQLLEKLPVATFKRPVATCS